MPRVWLDGNGTVFTAHGVLAAIATELGINFDRGLEEGRSESYATTEIGFDVIDDQQFRYVVRGLLDLSADGATLDGLFVTDL